MDADKDSPSLPPHAGGATPQSTHGKVPVSAGVLHNKLVDHIRSPSRQPSPQPTHLSVPGQAGTHTLVKEEGPGYVAPKFEGKEQQMEQGKQLSLLGRPLAWCRASAEACRTELK